MNKLQSLRNIAAYIVTRTYRSKYSYRAFVKGTYEELHNHYVAHLRDKLQVDIKPDWSLQEYTNKL